MHNTYVDDCNSIEGRFPSIIWSDMTDQVPQALAFMFSFSFFMQSWKAGGAFFFLSSLFFCLSSPASFLIASMSCFMFGHLSLHFSIIAFHFSFPPPFPPPSLASDWRTRDAI